MKRKMSFLVAGLLCLSLCLGAEAAGTVTDTLTVRVGYYGMEQDRYVEVATYHWSELYDALPLHYEAYSFFRSTDDGTYNTVIDSAYGFYLADLLDYAGIYSGDISVGRVLHPRPERRLFHLVHLCRPVRHAAILL